MNKEQIQKYCTGLAGAELSERAAPHNIRVFSVGGKPFAYFKTSEPERWRFSIRVTPERFIELTDMPGVKPARYMHRFHWVSILKVQMIDREYLLHLIDWSYKKALASLPKYKQRLVLEEGG